MVEVRAMQRWLVAIVALAFLVIVHNIGILSSFTLRPSSSAGAWADGGTAAAVAQLEAQLADQEGKLALASRALDALLALGRNSRDVSSRRRTADGTGATTGASATAAATPALVEPPRSPTRTASVGHNPYSALRGVGVGKRAVLIFCYNRPQYLERAMHSVLGRMPSDGRYQLVVTQDGDDAAVSSVVNSVGRGAVPAVVHLQHPRTEIVVGKKENAGYYYLARHYGWALSITFELLGYESAIILEVRRPAAPRAARTHAGPEDTPHDHRQDDIEIAADFFDYFDAMAPLLVRDPTLLTVSVRHAGAGPRRRTPSSLRLSLLPPPRGGRTAQAFSDNGQPEHVADASAVYRSDFFPGLGWLMTLQLWKELGPKWPRAYWDDWLREPANRRGRATVRPEMSRTYTYGVKGVSKGQFSSFLKNMRLAPSGGVRWDTFDTSVLEKAAYDAALDSALAAARVVRPSDLPPPTADAQASADCDMRIPYNDHREYSAIAKTLGLMMDIKAGVPRSGYRGVVTFRRKGCRVLVAPTYAVHSENGSIVR